MVFCALKKFKKYYPSEFIMKLLLYSLKKGKCKVICRVTFEI